ncbi:MAG: citramalate synthase, partial [bacterium]
MVAFGCTRRSQFSAADDPLITSLLEADTPVVCIFGKSWKLHVTKSLRISEEENLKLIADTVEFLKSQGKEVIYDAEHFFDGYKDDPFYAVETLKQAAQSGADVVVLCDTNGGTLPLEVSRIINKVSQELEVPLGVHFHNDSDLAVANTITGVEQGCIHVQGTINGYGERCGNANLCSVIPNLQLKRGYYCIPDENMTELYHLSHFMSEVANMHHQDNQPYVGKSAFAHKGGVHVSAIMKDR